MHKKVILMILDGWGVAQNPDVSAIDHANTPFIDALYEKHPNARLRTDGLNVGLPEGQMGNSEVGHMNLGAGRIVYQNLVKINLAATDGSLAREKEIVNAFNYAKENNKNVHFIGLLSDGGIHSHINHLKALTQAASDNKVTNVYIHAFTDGRDCDPKSGVGFITDLEQHLAKTTGVIASITGRYYAMDRDKRWERVALAYKALVNGEGEKSDDLITSVKESYANGITDEFIKPIVKVNSNKQPIGTIKEGDVVIYFNFRTDRGRELTQVLTQQDFPEHGMTKQSLYFVTLTNYDVTFKNLHIVYPKDDLKETLGEILEKHHKKQIRIAETEKYPHVTFFFSGGREEPFKGESRILCPSPKVATYDLKPEMSAYDIRDAIVPELKKQDVDFVCLNFANGDMVGHTGVMAAAIKACQAVDSCVKDVVSTALKNNYTTIIIADHGNCEKMINEDGTPNTSHTTFPVPVILVDKDLKKIKSGILSDIAPTILKLMGIKQPKVMTQKPLV